jgi:hypothetical protein
MKFSLILIACKDFLKDLLNYEILQEDKDSIKDKDSVKELMALQKEQKDCVDHLLAFQKDHVDNLLGYEPCLTKKDN